MQWYYLLNGDRKGPVEAEVIKNLLKAGGIKPEDLVWNETMGDKWAKISEVPLLAVPQDEEDEKAKEEFRRRIEEKQQADKAAKLKANMMFGAFALAIAALIGLMVFNAKQKPYRRLGISGRHPAGKFVTLDNLFKTEYQMTATDMDTCDFVAREAPIMRKYDDPKAKRGAYVTTAGHIVLFADDNSKLLGIMALFPSRGIRGPNMINPCVAGVIMEDFWRLFTKQEERQLKGPAHLPSDLADKMGLADLPECHYQYIETRGMRGVWMEYGMDTIRTMVYLEPAR